MAFAVWTDQQIIDQLDSGYKHQNATTITYSFAQDWRQDIGAPNGEIYGFTPLSSESRVKVAAAIKMWDDLIVQNMSEVSP